MNLIEQMRERRRELTERASAVVDRADSESRDLTDGELATVRELRTQVDELGDRIADMATAAERRNNATRADQTGNPTRERATASVLSEPRTYRPDTPHSFFSDAWRDRAMSDMQALERLQRHSREAEVDAQRAGIERRDVTTSAFGGLVVPQYLVEEYAQVLRNGRAVCNAVRRLPLPAEGMTLVIPRGETGATVAAQATQNTAVSETDVDFDNDLSIPVRTYAGQQDVSRQALERGYPGLDRLIYADLVGDYAAKLDTAVINGDGTSGTHTGLHNATGENVVTYTDATPTVPEAWPKLADGIQQIVTNRKQPANLLVMAPRRWAWFTSALDSNGRPLINIGSASDAMNAMGAGAADFGEGQLVGTLQGVPVLIDGNVPTTLGGGTEDEIFVLHREDPILWEESDGMPRQLRFDEVGAATLTVKLLVYGYSAFTPNRFPTGLSRITGTGLIAPTF